MTYSYTRKAYTVHKGVAYWEGNDEWSYDHRQAISIQEKLKHAYRVHRPADPNTLTVDREMLNEYIMRKTLLWKAGTVECITWKEAVLARLEDREAEYTPLGGNV